MSENQDHEDRLEPVAGKSPRWSASEAVRAAVVGALVASLVSGGFQIWSLNSGLRAAQEQSAEQNRQVMEQLAAQQRFSQELQAYQHELSIRHLETQDAFTRDQLRVQLDFENRWEERRLLEARRIECQADRSREHEVRLSLFRQFTEATSAFMGANDVDEIFSWFSSTVAHAMALMDFSEVSHFTELDWILIKDLGQSMVAADERRAEQVAAIFRLQSVLVAISASYPSDVRLLAADLAQSLPQSLRTKPGFSQAVEAATDLERPPAERKQRVDEATRALFAQRLEEHVQFAESLSRLSAAMAIVLFAPLKPCLGGAPNQEYPP